MYPYTYAFFMIFGFIALLKLFVYTTFKKHFQVKTLFVFESLTSEHLGLSYGCAYRKIPS